MPLRWAVAMFRRAAALQIRLAFVQSFLPERFSGVAPSAATRACESRHRALLHGPVKVTGGRRSCQNAPRPRLETSCRRRLRAAISYFLRVRIQPTSALMSASGTLAFGGIGTGPHTPAPPAFTLASSLAAAPASPLYLAATSL